MPRLACQVGAGRALIIRGDLPGRKVERPRRSQEDPETLTPESPARALDVPQLVIAVTPDGQVVCAATPATSGALSART